jgi:hypothetical protein
MAQLARTAHQYFKACSVQNMDSINTGIHQARLKGQCHEIFCFWLFSCISFPPAPEYPIRTVSNFFENSQRYSQVKVHHRYQRHRWQILPPVSLVLLIPVANLPPVSTTPAANLPPVSTTPVMVYSGAWGNLIHEKIQKSKIS